MSSCVWKTTKPGRLCIYTHIVFCAIAPSVCFCVSREKSMNVYQHSRISSNALEMKRTRVVNENHFSLVSHRVHKKKCTWVVKEKLGAACLQFSMLAIYLIVYLPLQREWKNKIIYVKGKWLSFLASRKEGMFFFVLWLAQFFFLRTIHLSTQTKETKKVLEMNHHHCRFYCLNDSRGRKRASESVREGWGLKCFLSLQKRRLQPTHKTAGVASIGLLSTRSWTRARGKIRDNDIIKMFFLPPNHPSSANIQIQVQKRRSYVYIERGRRKKGGWVKVHIPLYKDI